VIIMVIIFVSNSVSVVHVHIHVPGWLGSSEEAVALIPVIGPKVSEHDLHPCGGNAAKEWVRGGEPRALPLCIVVAVAVASHRDVSRWLKRLDLRR
jgi:hypothetical protein